MIKMKKLLFSRPAYYDFQNYELIEEEDDEDGKVEATQNDEELLESERLLQPRVDQGGHINVNSYSAISQEDEQLNNPVSGMFLFVFV